MKFSSIGPAHQEREDEDRGGTRGSSEVVSINFSIRSASELFCTP